MALAQSNLLTVVGGPTMNFEVTRMVRLKVNRALSTFLYKIQPPILLTIGSHRRGPNRAASR